jgi:hypothetical protein
MSKTKFFRVAVEGQTATDGRTITREMLTDIVSTFNTDTYGVRINMEHLRGFSDKPPFNALGDVLAVKVQEDTLQIDNKPEKRLALYAQLDPTDDLVEMNRRRQKVFTSIEPQPNFGGTGKYGLVGLAVTDSPASLGTHRLEFSVKKDDPAAAEIKADLDRRKSSPESFFSSAYETRFELEDDTPAQPGALDKLVEIFSGLVGKKEESKPEPKPETPPAGGDQGFAATMLAFTSALKADRQADQQASDRRFSAVEQSIADLKTSLESQPRSNFTARQPATGGSGHIRADC